MFKDKSIVYLLLACCFLFIPFLGSVHLFDWDEINFAECAREMILSKDYLRTQIDFKPFWEKPPLFIWLQVAAMKIFGINEWGARFPNVVVAFFTLFSFYKIGNKVANKEVSKWWILLYIGSWLPHFYFKTGLIDPLFNLLIFLAIYHVYALSNNETNRSKHRLLAGLFLGLAVLTKGPVAILIAILCLAVYLIVTKFKSAIRIKDVVLISLVSFGVVFIWFATVLLKHGLAYGNWFLNEFITYQIRLFRTEDADHGGPFVYHFIVLLIGCFPASLFLFKKHKENKKVLFNTWMWISLAVVLLLFSIVKTKIVHYSSFCYFPLSYLAAYNISLIISNRETISRWVKILLYSIGSIWSIVWISLPLIGIYKNKLIPFIEDPFAVGNLQAPVQWSFYEIGIGFVYLIGLCYIIFKLNSNFEYYCKRLIAFQVIFIFICSNYFTPKIEQYSQGAAIAYYQSFKDKDVFVEPLSYKSYAHLFYTNKIKSTKDAFDTLGQSGYWTPNGNIQRPSYFICKIMDTTIYTNNTHIQKMGEKNGFVFYKGLKD
jgi:4-amino-4-deoxy-L-arabinose transferase-like glycosyltransferase